MKIIVFLMAAMMACGTACAQQKETYMLRPHEKLPVADTAGFTKIFLAGTIDMGNSRDWQAELLEHFSDKDGKYLLFNPRQENWNGGKDGEMDYQVNWELDHLEQADIIIMYIMIVACEPDFYRYDNVRITCAYYGIPLYSSLEELQKASGL